MSYEAWGEPDEGPQCVDCGCEIILKRTDRRGATLASRMRNGNVVRIVRSFVACAIDTTADQNADDGNESMGRNLGRERRHARLV